MSEEEKKIFEYFKTKQVYDMELVFNYIPILLNLIENQQKELNNIKEIEKSHQEENGKLRVELEKEKERNELFVASGNNINLERHIKNNYISKDKIKEKIKELQEESKLAIKEKDYVIEAQLGIQIYILEELLGEK